MTRPFAPTNYAVTHKHFHHTYLRLVKPITKCSSLANDLFHYHTLPYIQRGSNHHGDQIAQSYLCLHFWLRFENVPTIIRLFDFCFIVLCTWIYLCLLASSLCYDYSNVSCNHVDFLQIELSSPCIIRYCAGNSRYIIN